MSAPTRRQLLRAAAGTAAGAILGARAGASEPIERMGGPRLKLSLAAYSFRDYLTGKSEPHMELMGFVDRCAQMDLDAVELTSYYFPKAITPRYVADLKRHCYLLGLDISGSPTSNTFTYPAGPQRDREIDHVRQWIDTAAALGAPTIRVFAGSAQPGQSEEEARRNCIECIEACCETAGQRGVILALENHGGIVAEPDGLLAIVKAVKSSWLGVNLDTGNFRTADPYADMARVAPYAVVVQVKTEVAPKGQPKREADLKREVQILKDVGYRGYVTLEYEAAEPALRAVPRHLERLRALL